MAQPPDTPPRSLCILRLSAIGTGPKPDFPVQVAGDATAEPTRLVPVYLNGWQDVPLFDRATLGAGAKFTGPAIVAQEDTTFAIPDGTTAHVDAHLNIHLTYAE